METVGVVMATIYGPVTRDALSPALLCCDVWEHAYYLKYRNRRPDYLSALVEGRRLGVMAGTSPL